MWPAARPARQVAPQPAAAAAGVGGDAVNFAQLTPAQLGLALRKVKRTGRRVEVLAQVKPGVATARTVRKVLDTDELAELRHIFDTIDLDHSGGISISELAECFDAMQAGMSPAEAAALRSELASMQAGETFNFDEFAALMLRVEIRLSQARLRSRAAAELLRRRAQRSRFAPARASAERARFALWELVNNPSSSRAARAFSVLMMVCILGICLLMIVASVPSARVSEEQLFFLTASAEALFTAELIARLASCPSWPRFAVSLLNWVDILAVVPFYLGWFLSPAAGLGEGPRAGLNASGSALAGAGAGADRVVKMLLLSQELARVSNALGPSLLVLARFFCFLKICRFLSWFSIFARAMKEAVFPLMVVLTMICIGMVLFSSLIFFVERGQLGEGNMYWVERDNVAGKDGVPRAMLIVSPFSSIPETFWFYLSTIATVGYGEQRRVPVSALGQLLSVCCMAFGILIMAIPISVISTSFQAEWSIEKRRAAVETDVGAHHRELMSMPLEELQRKNQRLQGAISSCERFAVGLAVHQDTFVQNSLFAMSVSRSERMGQKRAFQDINVKERGNRDFLLANLFEISARYLDSSGDE
jgi:hypothetical protein